MGYALDPGRWAAMNGYDVIFVANKDDGIQKADQYVILNRSVLVLEDSP